MFRYPVALGKQSLGGCLLAAGTLHPCVVPRELSLLETGGGHAGSCVAEPTAGDQGSPFSHPATPGAGSKHSSRPPGSTGWDQASHPPVPQCQGRLNPAPGSTGRRGPGPYNLLKEKWCHLPFQAPYLAEGQGQAAGGVVPSFSPQERQVGGTTLPSCFRPSPGSRGKAVEL